MLTVLASAVGPILFAASAEWYGSYTPVLLALTPLVLMFSAAAFALTLPNREAVETPLTETA